MSGAIDFSRIPPEQLAQIPAGVPHPGVIPDFVNPHSVGNYIVVASSLLKVIMVIFVSLRFYVVLAINKKMGPDDWTVIAGVLGICYYFVVVLLAVKVAKFGTHMWDISVLDMRTRSVAVIGFMSNGPPHIIWPCIKTTFFLMYLQFFWILDWVRRCVYFGLAAVWSVYVSMCIAQIAITIPPRGHGWVDSFASPGYRRTFQLCVPTASFSLASAIFILLLPMIAISHLRLSRAKKIGVAAMFSTGFICCIASSLSVYFQYRVYKNQNDYSYNVVFIYQTLILEMCVGISTSCMPSLARLHKEKTGEKLNSIVSSIVSPFRSTKATTFTGYSGPKRPNLKESENSPYMFMDGSLLESQSREEDLDATDSKPTARSHVGTSVP